MADTAYRSQEATSSVLHIWDIWADGAKKFFPYGKVRSAAGAVDSYFDFVEHVLEIQRQFAKSLVAYDHGDPNPGYKRDPKDMQHSKDMQDPRDMQYRDPEDMQYRGRDGVSKKS